MEEETTGALLPADVLLEIFVRVKDDPAALFRCATACKQWLRLILDRSFLRRCWQPEKNAPCCAFVGVFTQEPRPGPGEVTFQTPCFVPAPRSALANLGRRTLLSFIPSAPANLFDRAVPVAARHGLLLLRLSSADPNRSVVHLAVCHPLSGAHHVLPPVEWCSPSSAYNGYAILPGADRCSNECQRLPIPHFKVLMVDTKYNLYIFSSQEATSWRRVPHVCLVDECSHIAFGHDEAVVHHGAAHWRIGLSTMDMNADTDHLSRTELPIPYHHNTTVHSYSKLCLGTTVIDDDDEEPYLLRMREESLEVEIWERRKGDEEGVDDEPLAWHCARVIDLKQPQHMMAAQVSKLRMLGEKSGTLLLKDSCGHFYVADLKTGTMGKLRHWPQISRKAVPFETDWPAIFLYRLGSP